MAKKIPALNKYLCQTKFEVPTNTVPHTTAPFRHPVTWMAVRCESEIKKIILYENCDREMLEFAQKWRGNKFTWAKKLRSTPERRDIIYDWMKGTPGMLEWFLSPTAYHAPRTYPAFLRKAFGKVPPPRPYELACMKIGRIDTRYMLSKGVFYLRAYCFGFSLPQIARLTGEPLGFIQEEMYNDLVGLCTDPCFQLWCLNIDWEKVRWPINVDIGMLEKIRIMHELEKGPQFLYTSQITALTSSANFWSFVREGKLARRTGLRLQLNKNWLGTYAHRKTQCHPVKFHGRRAYRVKDPGKDPNTEAG